MMDGCEVQFEIGYNRMQGSVSRNNQDISFLQCYICFQNVKKPRMCPSCSKLACQHCLRTWIEESKPQCPHCRQPQLLGSFADCERFVNDIKHLLSSIDSNDRLKEKCSEHRIEMSYFCEGCQEAICSDCGMFGKHRGHPIIHLSRVYQENKNRILNQLAKFDNKIQLFRKNGAMIKQDLQRLHLQASQKKNKIEEHFVGLIERLEEEYHTRKQRVETKYQENLQEIEFLENFRDTICQDMEGHSEKDLITNSEELIKCIRSLCDREAEFDEEDTSLDTIHEILPKYYRFDYVLTNYSQLSEAIVYSDPQEINGIQWRLKIYPRGNGVAKGTHLSVFLQLSKGFENHNKYDYKIELVNLLNSKDSVVREYSSTFDIGQCWGYNQFIPIPELTSGFLHADDSLHFRVSIRNPSYRCLVRDQQKYIEVLEERLKSGDNPAPQHRSEKMNELVQELSERKQEIRSFLGAKRMREEQREEKSSSESQKRVQQQLEGEVAEQSLSQGGYQ